MKTVSIIIPTITAEACSPQIMRTLAFSVHAMLVREGVKAQAHDFLEDGQGFSRYCRQPESQVDVFCLVVFISNWALAKKLVKKIYQYKSARDRKIILIGPLAAYFYREFIEQGWADIVVRAEADFVIPKIVRADFAPQEMARISNVVFLQKDRLIITPLQYFDNLDDIPFLSPYFIERKLPAVISTSRGCPFSCSFCDRKYVWGARVRFRSESSVMSELRFLSSQGVRTLFFNDDNFIIDPLRVKRLCLQIIREKLTFRWECNSRVDAVLGEVLRIMRLAGCQIIYYGVESGSAKVRRSLRKNFSVKTVLKTVEMTRKAGVSAGLYFMTGSPVEDQFAWEETEKLIKILHPLENASVNALAMLPGTRLYEKYLAETGERKDFILDREWPVYYQDEGKKKCVKLEQCIRNIS